MSYEQFGDRLTALEKYHSLVDLLADDSAERPFVNLARRQIAAIERDTSTQERVRFIEQRLDDAERLADLARQSVADGFTAMKCMAVPPTMPLEGLRS